MDGETVADNETLPVSPRLFSVTDDEAEVPASPLAGLMLDADITKSAVTVTVIVTE